MAKPTADRRGFLKGSLAMGAATPALAQAAKAQAQARAAGAAPGPAIETPLARPPWLINAESKPPAPEADAQTVKFPGSDYMVDLIRATGMDYVALSPGSTFRGLQESLVTYGAGKPQMIVCTHEEISAGICHGYAKVAGKPMACVVHSTVGLQHASMAIYNAWCDRAPMMVISGNVVDATQRRPGIEWMHTALDLGAMVRDFVKWDDQPANLVHFGESFMRAHTLSITPPMEPVMIVADAELQEAEAKPPNLTIPPWTHPRPPTGDPEGVGLVADMLLGARTPVIVADRAARTPEGFKHLVELAELVNAPVIDMLSRLNFPSNHYLNHTYLQDRLVPQADFILGLELTDPWGLINTTPDIIGRPSVRLARADCKTAMISAEYLYIKSNEQDFERYYSPDLAIAADAEATLPLLIAAVRQRLTPERQAAVAARKPALEAAFHKMRDDARYDAARGWDSSPVSTARLSMEVWDKIKHEDWAFVSSSAFISRWPNRLWDFTQHHQYIGGEGGFGLGYGGPSAVGAAIAHHRAGRLAVAIQTDGDLMMTPGIFWTLAHHSIPLLMVMHNNRAWHQETMHLQRMASRRERHPENALVGTVINDPIIDYSKMADSMGVWGEGPVTDPAKLGAVLARALAVVKSGKPALVDVYTQPR